MRLSWPARNTPRRPAPSTVSCSGRHQGGIGAQLASGVRAFLVHLHYGARVQDLVRTDFRSEAEEELAKADLSPTSAP